MLKKYRSIGLCLALLLTLVISGERGVSAQADKLIIQGSRTGIASALVVARQRVFSINQMARPSASLGLFVSSYLAQGAFVEAKSALVGVASQRALLKGQDVPSTSESFALLTDLGIVLQVDIVDLLNRSPDRRLALDQYLRSLKGVGGIAEQKHNELEVKAAQLKADAKTVKKNLREVERSAKDALKNENYRQAAELQEQMVTIESQLAGINTELKQVDDMVDRFADLLDIAKERIVAIEANRAIILAGLQVSEVPGIEDFNILTEGQSYKRSSRSKNTGDGDLFGSQHIAPDGDGNIFGF